MEGLTLLANDEKETSNYQYVVLEIDDSKCILTRDQLIQVLYAENVLARRYFYPGCHRAEPYRTLYPDAHLHLPQTERVANRVITLPTGQVITPETIGVICDIIRTALKHAWSETSYQLRALRDDPELFHKVEHLEGRHATIAELELAHDPTYVRSVGARFARQ